MPEADLERDFPKLAEGGFQITSPACVDYNCIAWVAQETDKPWWPVELKPYHWPLEVPSVITVEPKNVSRPG